jgi:organic radical activating enzyme
MVNKRMKTLEVRWKLNSYCEHDCEYCPNKWSGGELDKTLDQYLDIVEKLQNTRYLHGDTIKWSITGGEPLHFPNLNLLLRKMKEKNSYIRLDTSGGDSWFGIMEIINYVDYFKVTHHYWQNSSVLDYILDICKENNKKIMIMVPLIPGKIKEGREKVQELIARNIAAKEQVLTAENGDYWSGYSSKDINLIQGFDEDYVKPVASTVPEYVPLDQPPKDNSPSYTGKQCYAGIDHILINNKGFVVGSECGGRDLGNVFDPEWQAPATSFTCPMLWCRSLLDRTRLRIDQ